MRRTTAGADEARWARTDAARGLDCGPKRAARAAPTNYSCAMSAEAKSLKPKGLARALGWPRVLLVLGVSVPFGALNSLPAAAAPAYATIGHAVVVGFAVMLAYGLLEQRPAKPSRRLPAWVLQLIGVVVAVPIGVLLAHSFSMAIDMHSAHDRPQTTSLITVLVEGLLFGPWIALGAMVRQRDVFARDQALEFELERSELEREASEARLRLLQAQVKPHFLFNTLANVQALVDAGSPQASSVLKSLTAYLRAAVPRLQESTTTIGQEIDLARAYLEVMHMRMPDRLQFALNVDEHAAALRCPPMTLLTLVENAVRHGIDPGEDGGRIDIDVSALDGRCKVRVTDTGVGMRANSSGLGSGLASLRERMQLAFGGEAELRLEPIEPRGVRASLEFPARTAPT
jgi:LytS/YehU family sensor histidine kinase